MNIAIIIHSKTGITRKLGNLLADKLRKKGHLVDMIDLRTDPPVSSGSVKHHPEFSIVNPPDCKKYNAFLVGGPVWAFSASPVIYECIKSEFKGISGKRAIPFVTMGFPLESMGGKQAIDLMINALEEKGADVLPGKIVPGLFHNRDEVMEKVASEIVSLF
jgi:menaquinone-dependent protoporphyrinogen IX oxidase